MGVDIHVRHQLCECIVPAIFMTAKSHYALVRVAIPILQFTQCTITQYSSYYQAKLAVIVVGSVEFLSGDILYRFSGETLTWPKSLVGYNQYLITLVQL